MLKRIMLLSMGWVLCAGIIGCGGGEPYRPENAPPPPEGNPKMVGGDGGEAVQAPKAPD